MKRRAIDKFEKFRGTSIKSRIPYVEFRTHLSSLVGCFEKQHIN
jgi:hypothetical protein